MESWQQLALLEAWALADFFRAYPELAQLLKERQMQQLSPDTEELIDEIQNNEGLYLIANTLETADDFEREFAVIGHVNGLRDIDWQVLRNWWHQDA